MHLGTHTTQKYPHHSSLGCFAFFFPHTLCRWTKPEKLNFWDSDSIKQPLSSYNKHKCSYKNLIKELQHQNPLCLYCLMFRGSTSITPWTTQPFIPLLTITIASHTALYSTANWMLPGKSRAAQSLNITHCTAQTCKICTVTYSISRALPLYGTL